MSPTVVILCLLPFSERKKGVLNSVLKVNAFPSTSALDRKNKLWTCYTRLQAKMGRRACNFIPENYNLPAQKHQLMAKVTRTPVRANTALHYVCNIMTRIT